MTKADECVLERRGRKKEEDSVYKGHFGRRIIELTQNTVFKGQGFEGPVGFALKKKTINEIENLSSG